MPQGGFPIAAGKRLTTLVLGNESQLRYVQTQGLQPDTADPSQCTCYCAVKTKCAHGDALRPAACPRCKRRGVACVYARVRFADAWFYCTRLTPLQVKSVPLQIPLSSPSSTPMLRRLSARAAPELVDQPLSDHAYESSRREFLASSQRLAAASPQCLAPPLRPLAPQSPWNLSFQPPLDPVIYLALTEACFPTRPLCTCTGYLCGPACLKDFTISDGLWNRWNTRVDGYLGLALNIGIVNPLHYDSDPFGLPELPPHPPPAAHCWDSPSSWLGLDSVARLESCRPSYLVPISDLTILPWTVVQAH